MGLGTGAAAGAGGAAVSPALASAVLGVAAAGVVPEDCPVVAFGVCSASFVGVEDAPVTGLAGWAASLAGTEARAGARDK